MEFVAELEGLGETCHDAGLLFMLSAQSFAFVAPVLEHGSLSQQERRLRDLAQGRLRGAFAMTEADSGSSAFELTTRAHRQGDGFRLEGEKVWVALAPVADEALVIARTSDGSPLSSLSAFLVDLNLPGVHRGPAEDLSGLRTAPVGSLRFENVELPADALCGALCGARGEAFAGSCFVARIE